MYSFTNETSRHTDDEISSAPEYGPGMELNARILKARKDAGMTQEALAGAVGKTRAAVAQWESGDVRPRHSTLEAVAKATGKSLAWLETGEETGGLRVIGIVAGGVWKEGAATFRPYRVAVAPDPGYPATAQRLYRVEGNSVNRAVSDGEYVHTVDIIAADIAFEVGDIVIVRRTKHGTSEYTAKQAARVGQEWVLRPLSDDPDWQEDIVLNGDEDTMIEVTDIVIAKWSPVGRGRKL